MAKRVLELNPFEVRRLLAEALTEQEGRVYRGSDIEILVTETTQGYGMAEETVHKFAGATATFIDRSEPEEEPPGPRKAAPKMHPGWAKHMGVRLCPECSTRRLDENGRCPNPSCND